VNFQWGNTLPEMSAMTIPYGFAELERIRKFPAATRRSSWKGCWSGARSGT
jgi:C4-dicarboxylate-binding protein DctP